MGKNNLAAEAYEARRREAVQQEILMREAIAIHAETGLTPRQLADQRAELLYALKQIREHLNGLGAEDAVMRLVNNAIANAERKP